MLVERAALQMLVERAALALIGAHVLVDALMTDAELFFLVEPTGDLFGTPLLRQVLFDFRLRSTSQR
jgi:hypothetical protein